MFEHTVEKHSLHAWLSLKTGIPGVIIPTSLNWKTCPVLTGSSSAQFVRGLSDASHVAADRNSHTHTPGNLRYANTGQRWCGVAR